MPGMQELFWSQANSLDLADMVEVPVLDYFFDIDFRFRNVSFGA